MEVQLEPSVKDILFEKMPPSIKVQKEDLQKYVGEFELSGMTVKVSIQGENTLKLSGTSRPKATIEDIAWLAGHWKGNALGGVSEEIWSPPQAKSMMGSYRLIKNDTLVVFYEIVTITEDGQSLTLKLKHFNTDLTGW